MRRSAAGHDHSTEHVTDVRTRRVSASTGDGCAALGWDYPGSTLLEVRVLRSDHGFAPAADGDAPEAGAGAASGAGQTVVYHDVSGSFRDSGLQNGRAYYYTVFARHPGKDGAELAAALRQRGIIVRHFKLPRIDQFLRITVGSDEQCQALVATLTEILRASE